MLLREKNPLLSTLVRSKSLDICLVVVVVVVFGMFIALDSTRLGPWKREKRSSPLDRAGLVTNAYIISVSLFL